MWQDIVTLQGKYLPPRSAIKQSRAEYYSTVEPRYFELGYFKVPIMLRWYSFSLVLHTSIVYLRLTWLYQTPTIANYFLFSLGLWKNPINCHWIVRYTHMHRLFQLKARMGMNWQPEKAVCGDNRSGPKKTCCWDGLRKYLSFLTSL